MAQVRRPSRELPNKAGGRPSSYGTELADEICERLACGESLRTICADDGMPHRTTVVRWLSRHEAFLARYEVARRIQSDTWRDAIYDLANAEPPRDDAGRIDRRAMQHRRNQIGTLQWLSAKHAPKRFGGS